MTCLIASCSGFLDGPATLTIKNDFSAQLIFSLYDESDVCVYSGKVNGNSSVKLSEDFEQGEYKIIFRPYYYPADDGYRFRFEMDSVLVKLTVSYSPAKGGFVCKVS